MLKYLKGKWKNQLGSVMEFTEVKDGYINGVYGTAVGNVKREDLHEINGTYQLQKWKDEDKKEHDVLLITFSVQWTKLKDKTKNPSCTTWSGQCIISNGVVTEIDTTWILRRFGFSKGLWDTTLFNKDYFKKVD